MTSNYAQMLHDKISWSTKMLTFNEKWFIKKFLWTQIKNWTNLKIKTKNIKNLKKTKNTKNLKFKNFKIQKL